MGTRDERQLWILEHWPHVVEYCDVTDTLTRGRWGPDRHQLLDQLDHQQIGDKLAAAIDADETWLRPALCALDAHDDPLDERQIDWLNAVADYRRTNHVTTRDPLGPVPIEPDQLGDFDDLAGQLAEARPEPQLERDDFGIELRTGGRAIGCRDCSRSPDRCWLQVNAFITIETYGFISCYTRPAGGAARRSAHRTPGLEAELGRRHAPNDGAGSPTERSR